MFDQCLFGGGQFRYIHLPRKIGRAICLGVLKGTDVKGRPSPKCRCRMRSIIAESTSILEIQHLQRKENHRDLQIGLSCKDRRWRKESLGEGVFSETFHSIEILEVLDVLVILDFCRDSREVRGGLGVLQIFSVRAPFS